VATNNIIFERTFDMEFCINETYTQLIIPYSGAYLPEEEKEEKRRAQHYLRSTRFDKYRGQGLLMFTRKAKKRCAGKKCRKRVMYLNQA